MEGKIEGFSKVILIFCILVFNLSNCFSEDKDSSSENKRSLLSLQFSKRSLLTYNHISDNLKQDGNNFYGIAYSYFTHLTKNIIFIPEEKIQFGNIDGKYSLLIGLTPLIFIGTTNYHLFFGSGPAWLISSDGQNIGISANIGFDIKLFKSIRFNINYGYEGYGKINYQIVGFSLNYFIYN